MAAIYSTSTSYSNSSSCIERPGHQIDCLAYCIYTLKFWSEVCPHAQVLYDNLVATYQQPIFWTLHLTSGDAGCLLLAFLLQVVSVQLYWDRLPPQQTERTQRPMVYAPRTMTITEKRYAQIEEALALTWSCERWLGQHSIGKLTTSRWYPSCAIRITSSYFIFVSALLRISLRFSNSRCLI